MKRISIVILLSAFALSLFSQNSQKWERVKADKDYIYGEGWGNSIVEADNNALGDLIGKIAMSVRSDAKSTGDKTIKNGEINENTQFTMSVKTYSRATLSNTEREIIENEPDAHVGRYLKRSEIEKIFGVRIAKIKEFVDAAQRAEEKGKADDALRNYYWAMSLLKTLRPTDAVTYTTTSGQDVLLSTWIPEQMNNVFADLKANVVKRTDNDVELYITYRDKPVNSVDYTYFDGQSWSNIYSAKDGRGVLELASGNTSDQFQLKYEFEYRGESQIDDELEQVLECVPSTRMRNAYQYVSSSVSKTALAASTAKTTGSKSLEKSFSKTSAQTWAAPEPISDPEYMNITMKVEEAIRTRRYESVRNLFTAEGWDMYTKLIHYGNAKLLGTPSYSFMKCGDYVMGRGMQMSFSFKTGMRKAFTEDVVFSFDKDKKITSIAMGLGQTAADDILNKGDWPEAARVALMNFLENYKTAYALKRLDYIKSIFDDDAVIIVGNVVKKRPASSSGSSGSRSGSGSGSGAGSSNRSQSGKAPVGNVSRNGDNGMSMHVAYPDRKNYPQPKTSEEIIRYNRYDKNEFLNHLGKQFAKQEFINIRFANNDVVKLNPKDGGDVYSIQIAQDYYSSTYGDKGYLFLMVDITDPEKPIIKVRTWQPEKDPNFGLYGPADFK